MTRRNMVSQDRDNPQPMMVETVQDSTESGWIVRQISLGNLLLMLGMAGSIGAGLYEGGAIRATLENGIDAERQLRVSDIAGLNQRITELRVDVAEVRTLIINRGVSR